MGKLIKLQITEQMEWCDLIKKENPIEEVPYCYGYPDECSVCEVKKYLDRVYYNFTPEKAPTIFP